MIVAVAVYLLIQVCMVRETYDRLLQEGEYTAKAKKIDRKTEKWAAIYWPLVTAVYLGYSCIHLTGEEVGSYGLSQQYSQRC